MLLLWLFFVWSLWAIAATLQVRLTDIRDPLPDGQQRFMSILPVIPLHPLFFWGVAFWIDGIRSPSGKGTVSPWGTIGIAGIHLLLAVALVVSIVRDWLLLTREKKSRR